MLKINYINFVWKFVFIFMFVVNNDIAPSESKYAIDYQKAFDQEQFYKSFVLVMKKWECSENVFPNAVKSPTLEDVSLLLEALKLDNPFLNVSCFNNVFYSIKKLILGLNNQELQWSGDTTLYNKLRIEFEALKKEILKLQGEILEEKKREATLIHANTTLEGSSNQLITQLREKLDQSGLDLAKKLKDLIEKLDPEERFRANCIKQVDKAHEKARQEPLIEAAASFAASAAAAAVTLGRGNNISVYALAQDSKDLITTSLKYFGEPVTHSLGELERLYAINQCRIPRILWQTIINHFMLAQENKFETQNCMKFIDFSIGIKTFPSQRIDRQINKEHVLAVLNEKINKFFIEYC